MLNHPSLRERFGVHDHAFMRYVHYPNSRHLEIINDDSDYYRKAVALNSFVLDRMGEPHGRCVMMNIIERRLHGALISGESWNSHPFFASLMCDVYAQFVLDPLGDSEVGVVLQSSLNFIGCIKRTSLRNKKIRDQALGVVQSHMAQRIRDFNDAQMSWSPKALAVHLLGAFFHTGVIQITDLLTHCVLAVRDRQSARCAETWGGVSDETVRTIIFEALRLYPPTPQVIRKATADCTFGEHTLVAGSELIVDIERIQRVGWADAEQFRPSRWASDRAGGGEEKGDFMPFGAGSRSCPAASHAMVVGTMLLKELLRLGFCGDTATKPSRRMPAGIELTLGCPMSNSTRPGRDASIPGNDCGDFTYDGGFISFLISAYRHSRRYGFSSRLGYFYLTRLLAGVDALFFHRDVGHDSSR